MKFFFTITFPTSLDSLTNPAPTDLLENATLALDHDQQHSNVNDAVEALEAKVGANSSAVTTSHDYKLSGVTSSDKAVSKTGSETLTNKTLTSPVINVGSDTTGDLYYRNSGGLFTCLPIGSSLQILQSNGTIPAWVANPSVSTSTYSTSGIFTLDAGIVYYAADAGSNDTYVISLSTAPPAYVVGQTFTFKANTANTGTATLNVNGLGAKTIVTGVSTTLATGDILANQFVTVQYDGTNFVLKSPKTMQASNGQATIGSSTTVTVTTGFRPRHITLHATNGGSSGGTVPATSNGGYDASTGTMWCNYTTHDTNGAVNGSGNSTAFALNITYGTTPSATSVVINNITDTGFDTVYTKGTAGPLFSWTAIA